MSTKETGSLSVERQKEIVDKLEKSAAEEGLELVCIMARSADAEQLAVAAFWGAKILDMSYMLGTLDYFKSELQAKLNARAMHDMLCRYADSADLMRKVSELKEALAEVTSRVQVKIVEEEEA